MSEPAEGWYPDPNGAPHLRWWDGQAWTDYVEPYMEPTSSAWAERECAPKPMRTLASRRHTARAAPTNVMILNAMEDEPVLAVGIGT